MDILVDLPRKSRVDAGDSAENTKAMNPAQSPISFLGRRWTSLLLFSAVTALAAVAGAIASVNAPDFYESLAKPTWAPSPRVFGPIWTVLYVFMAFAAWLIWQKDRLRAAKGPLPLYIAQLLLNGLWPWLFFSWQLGGWALMEIVVLWFILLLTVINFWRIWALAGLLLLPYWVWISFAAVLTAQILRLNPAVF